MNILRVSSTYLIIELIILFITIPIILFISIPMWVKISLIIIAFVYVLFILYKQTQFKIKLPGKKILVPFLKSISLRLLIVTVFGLFFVKIAAPESFFRLITEDIKLWVFIVFIYSIGSVLPQEIVYRNFFFKRYQKLFNNNWLFLVINSLLFSISHLFLENWIVLGITFIGGIMFALTYQKTTSTWLVLIEHSLYGLILFTIGIGPLLAFPS